MRQRVIEKVLYDSKAPSTPKEMVKVLFHFLIVNYFLQKSSICWTFKDTVTDEAEDVK